MFSFPLLYFWVMTPASAALSYYVKRCGRGDTYGMGQFFAFIVAVVMWVALLALLLFMHLLQIADKHEGMRVA